MAASAGVTMQRWTARPQWARACRIVAFAGPVAAVTVLAYGVAAWLPTAPGSTDVARWIAIAVVAVVAAILAERLLSVLLPVAALLELDLGFPDGAPSRLRIAARAALHRPSALHTGRSPAGGGLDTAVEAVLVHYATTARPVLASRPHLEQVRALAVLVAARLGLSVDATDRMHWALLLRELGSLRSDERAADHPLVVWLGAWAALLHGPFVVVAGRATSPALESAANAAAVADAYAVVTAAHPYRRGSESGHAGGRLKVLGDSRLQPEVIDALLTLPPARLRSAIGFSPGVFPSFERFAPAPQPLMAATAIVVVLVLAATSAMRGDSGQVADQQAELAGLDTQPLVTPAGEPSLPTAVAAPERVADADAADGAKDDGALVGQAGAGAGGQFAGGHSAPAGSSGSRAVGSTKPSLTTPSSSTPSAKPTVEPTPKPSPGTGGGGGGGGADPDPDPDPGTDPGTDSDPDPDPGTDPGTGPPPGTDPPETNPGPGGGATEAP